MADAADAVDDAMKTLLLAIQNVGVVGECSNVHVNEVRIAAIYFASVVMDCLASLIAWVNASSIPFLALG